MTGRAVVHRGRAMAEAPCQVVAVQPGTGHHPVGLEVSAGGLDDRRRPRAHRPEHLGAKQQRRTSPLELLWDLVFVFAVTQVTTLLSSNLSWAGFGRSMLVLALIWWAWSAFVWAANAQSAASPALRLCLLLATLFIFISGLAVPRAFLGEGTLFATAVEKRRPPRVVVW